MFTHKLHFTCYLNLQKACKDDFQKRNKLRSLVILKIKWYHPPCWALVKSEYFLFLLSHCHAQKQFFKFIF